MSREETDTVIPDEVVYPEVQRRRLSVLRILAALVIACLAAGGVWLGLRTSAAKANAAVVQSWFAPYVDVTATPQYAFENTSAATPTAAVLGFVVSSRTAPCIPSWGAAYSLAEAGDGLDLDRRVARLRQIGGAVTVSFGGAANSEMSIGCTDVAQLTAAYRSVVDRYSIDAIDLDVEGSTSSAPAVATRRAQAMAALVTQEAAAGRALKVWLTLPVGPSGLTSEGLVSLTAILAARVPLAGVNAMTMDYGVVPAGRSMAAEGELALTALAQQVRAAYRTAGTALTEAQSWQLLGATPMIGQNDIATEHFSLVDARQLVGFAQLHHLARLSMWSANRDQGCGPNYPDVRVVSDACSGATQSAGDYAAVLKQFTSGAAPAPATTASGSAALVSPSAVAAVAVDDPAKSPYAIWNANQAYPKDTKIVWHHSVYAAKWYSVGDQPDVPVAQASDTPWTLIGPVLPGEHPAATPTLKSGTYPVWTADAPYVAGSRVLFQGTGYQAKWWTQGDTPGAPPSTPSAPSPWQLIGSQ